MDLRKFIFLLFFLLSCLLLLFCVYGYPLFGGNSVCFIPAAYYISHGQGLVNLLYDARIDTVHHSFLFYPPLFPYVLAGIGALLPQSQNLYHIVLGIINIVTLLVLILSVLKAAGIGKDNHTKAMYVFATLWLLACCTFQDTSTGRPEILAKLILSLLILNNVYKGKIRHEANGMLVFMAAINSPVSAFYICVITAGIYVWRREYKQVIRTAIAFGVCGLVFVSIYPYTVPRLLDGMRQHAHNVIFTRNDTATLHIFFLHHIINPVATFGIGIFLLSVGILFYKLRQRKDVLLFFAALMFLICYFTFKILALSYNLYVLSPAMLFLIFVFYAENEARPVKHKYIKCISLVVLVGCSVGIVRRTMVFATCLDRPFSSTQVREEMDALAPVCGSIGVSPSLFPMALPYKNVHIAEEAVLKTGSYDYIILQQNYAAYTPPALTGYTLVKDNFIYAVPRLWKIPLGNTYPWYQYAVYRKI